mmetsp:Transcript_79316/g.201918  ORF Transcript_79316/g.201918 Transcript_79316/m.201918 type:complete len:80 (-) Transcript_79316:2389-2628(-)
MMPERQGGCIWESGRLLHHREARQFLCSGGPMQQLGVLCLMLAWVVCALQAARPEDLESRGNSFVNSKLELELPVQSVA